MQCPRDQTPLRQFVRRGTTFEVCEACNGRWLDEEELERLVLGATKVRTSQDTLARSLKTMEREALFFESGSETEIDCPRCRTRMKKVKFVSGGSEVTADRCEKCRGLWFDSGEPGALFVLLERRLPIRPSVAIAALLLLALGVVIAVLAAGD